MFFFEDVPIVDVCIMQSLFADFEHEKLHIGERIAGIQRDTLILQKTLVARDEYISLLEAQKAHLCSESMVQKSIGCLYFFA